MLAELWEARVTHLVAQTLVASDRSGGRVHLHSPHEDASSILRDPDRHASAPRSSEWAIRNEGIRKQPREVGLPRGHGHGDDEMHRQDMVLAT